MLGLQDLPTNKVEAHLYFQNECPPSGTKLNQLVKFVSKIMVWEMQKGSQTTPEEPWGDSKCNWGQGYALQNILCTRQFEGEADFTAVVCFASDKPHHLISNFLHPTLLETQSLNLFPDPGV